MCAPESGPYKNLGGLYPALCEFTGEAADFLDRLADELFAVWRSVFFRRDPIGLMAHGRHHGMGGHDQKDMPGASHATAVSPCDRGRVRSWRSQTLPRSASGFLRP
jgi:hypothetical protein